MSVAQLTSTRSATCSRAFSVGPRPAMGVRRVMAAPAAASRRESLGAALATIAAVTLATTAPAQAFFGVGEDMETVVAAYVADTTRVLELTNATLASPKDDPAREEQVKALRQEINKWVATYRREGKVAGRPSFGNTYSALNALAGHFNSFGAEAPIPKKRLERLTKEIKDATLYLSRGR